MSFKIRGNKIQKHKKKKVIFSSGPKVKNKPI